MGRIYHNNHEVHRNISAIFPYTLELNYFARSDTIRSLFGDSDVSPLAVA